MCGVHVGEWDRVGCYEFIMRVHLAVEDHISQQLQQRRQGQRDEQHGSEGEDLFGQLGLLGTRGLELKRGMQLLPVYAKAHGRPERHNHTTGWEGNAKSHSLFKFLGRSCLVDERHVNSGEDQKQECEHCGVEYFGRLLVAGGTDDVSPGGHDENTQGRAEHVRQEGESNHRIRALIRVVDPALGS